jgi:putative tricarboxylic transport membrane protein
VKLNDAVAGVLLLALAAAVGWHIRGFPQMPGQKFGPALFPGIIAAGLAACGALLVVRGVRSGDALVRLAPWTRSPSLVANFLLVCGALAFYAIASEALGFLVTGTVLLLALFAKLGVPALRGVVVAVIAALVIHSLFYKVLRVPLPWGLLQPVAW